MSDVIVFSMLIYDTGSLCKAGKIKFKWGTENQLCH